MLEMFTQGLSLACTWSNLLFMFIGIIVGLVFGSIPGLTFSTALILLIPLTFNLDSTSAISLLLGVFASGMSGGAISAILLGIPGTPAAACTVIDGHILAKKGQAGKALGMAVYASVFGGLFSLLMLVSIAPLLAKVAIKLGPAEIFSIVIFGLSTIVSLSGENVVKGLMAGLFGLLLCTVGLDPVLGVQRFTFDNPNLMSGIGIMPVMIGMFALPEVMDNFFHYKYHKGVSQPKEKTNVKANFPTFQEIKSCFPLVVKCSFIGGILGAIPGIGGPVAAFMGYDQAKRKNPKCGTGELDGVAAPEAANNAVTGGTLIPLLTLGIPGDSAAAIVLGAFLIHGLIPGPLLFAQNGPAVYSIFISIFIINIMILIIQFYGVRLFVKVLDIPMIILMSFIAVVSVVGSFAINLNFIDILIMFFSGVLAYFMRLYGFPTAPLVLAIVLGFSIEDNLRKAIILTNGHPQIILTKPVCIVFFILSLIILLAPTLKPWFIEKKNSFEVQNSEKQ